MAAPRSIPHCFWANPSAVLRTGDARWPQAVSQGARRDITKKRGHPDPDALAMFSNDGAPTLELKFLQAIKYHIFARKEVPRVKDLVKRFLRKLGLGVGFQVLAEVGPSTAFWMSAHTFMALR